MKGQATKSIAISEEMVAEAYKKVKANQGSAGIDGQDWEQFDSKLSQNLYKIWNRLSSGSYFPPAVKAVSIPKKDGGKRILGIPTIGDRIAQQVIKSYLEPRLEAQFSEHSYGYRPLRSAHQALEAVQSNVRQSAWIVDIDIKGFFDNMPHDLLLKALDRHVEEKWVKMYIIRWLEAPLVESQGDSMQKREKGTPQGGVISPLLSNLFLHYGLDKWLGKNYPKLNFVRYADDIVIHCNSETEAKEVLEAVKVRLCACGLTVNEGKTKIVHCRDYRRKKEEDYPVKFDFLGFSFQPRPAQSNRGGMFLVYGCAISKTAEQSILKMLRATRLHKQSNIPIEQIAAMLNPKIRGWINYYGKFRRYELDRVFHQLHFRLMKWVKNRYKIYSIAKAYKWLKRLREQSPKLFYHWSVGFRI